MRKYPKDFKPTKNHKLVLANMKKMQDLKDLRRKAAQQKLLRQQMRESL